MSTHVSARVWKHSQSKGSARLVALYLADIADELGYCWPKMDSIAAAANISERQARAAVAALEAAGEVAYIAGQGRGHVSIYTVIVGLSPAEQAERLAGLEDKAEEIAGALQARRDKKVQSSHLSERKKVQPSQVLEPEKVQSSHPLPAEKVQSAQIKGANRVRALGSPTPEPALIRHGIRHEESHESTSTTTTTHARAKQTPAAPAGGGGGGAALLAAEGFSRKAIEAFGHFPAEVLRAEILRRRALGQRNGAIYLAWKDAPPGSATLPPAAPASAEPADEQLRQEFRALAAQQQRRERPARASPPGVPPELRRIWQAAQAALQQALPRQEYDTWLRPAQLAGLDAASATVAAPNADHAATLQSRYAAPLRRALGDAAGRPLQLVFTSP